MKKIIYKLQAKLLTILGDIRISKAPPFLYYDTVDYKIKGNTIEKIQETLRPGDIIIRGYDSYIDSKFIPDPLSFSHGAIYIGNNTIIHAVAEGVSKIHLYDFLQCDRVAIFRPMINSKSKSQTIIRKAIKTAEKYLGTDYDFSFNNGDSAIYCFELVSLAYPSLWIKRTKIKKLFGLLRKEVYIAESLFKNKNLKCIFHYNPKYNIILDNQAKE